MPFSRQRGITGRATDNATYKMHSGRSAFCLPEKCPSGPLEPSLSSWRRLGALTEHLHDTTRSIPTANSHEGRSQKQLSHRYLEHPILPFWFLNEGRLGEVDPQRSIFVASHIKLHCTLTCPPPSQPHSFFRQCGAILPLPVCWIVIQIFGRGLGVPAEGRGL